MGSYNGVTAVSRIYDIAYLTMLSAQPLPIISSYPNETYSLGFYGPALRCSASTNDTIVRNISTRFSPHASNGRKVNFVSWAGPAKWALFVGPSEEFDAESLDNYSPYASYLTVVTTTGNWNRHFELDGIFARRANVTECALYNASYSVDFTFRYPEQKHTIHISEWINTVGASSIRLINDAWRASMSYRAVMDAFGKIFVGSSVSLIEETNTGQSTSRDRLKIDWDDEKSIRIGLEQLFQNITLSLLSETGLMQVVPPPH